MTLLDPALSAIFLGFVLGLQHATDPDHLVAVATILTRERRFFDGAMVGVLWGAGHMTTLTIVGAIIIGLKLTITPAVGSGLELVHNTDAGPAELYISADGQESNRVRILLEP